MSFPVDLWSPYSSRFLHRPLKRGIELVNMGAAVCFKQSEKKPLLAPLGELVGGFCALA